MKQQTRKTKANNKRFEIQGRNFSLKLIELVNRPQSPLHEMKFLRYCLTQTYPQQQN